MQRLRLCFLLGIAGFGIQTPAMAADNWSLAATAGTIGFGGNVSWRFADHFALTTGYSGFTYDDLDREVSGIDYFGDIEADIYSLKLDIYPWVDSGFFLSAGAVRPDIQLRAVGRPNSRDGLPPSVTLGNGNVVATDDLIGLDGHAELSDGIEPYLGIGWRSTSREGLGFYAEAGAFLINPEVSLSPRTRTSHPTVNALLQRYADEEEQDVQDELDKYSVYPVVVLGLEYTF
ncbi:hypothetical protein [Salinicola avicenniae]|uniref:hypothetical protein n=1 Tax=Salinicola avicenniae TaxID=2916836 RepID=UPI0020747C8D|nr:MULTISPECIES: hypothetical protein [unclassified Salinicola]